MPVTVQPSTDYFGFQAGNPSIPDIAAGGVPEGLSGNVQALLNGMYALAYEVNQLRASNESVVTAIREMQGTFDQDWLTWLGITDREHVTLRDIHDALRTRQIVVQTDNGQQSLWDYIKDLWSTGGDIAEILDAVLEGYDAATDTADISLEATQSGFLAISMIATMEILRTLRGIGPWTHRGSVMGAFQKAEHIAQKMGFIAYDDDVLSEDDPLHTGVHI